MPIGGSTARVAPLFAPLPTAPRSHYQRESLPPSLSLFLSLAPKYRVSPPLALHSPREYVCHAFSAVPPATFLSLRLNTRPRRPHAPSRSHRVRISPTRSPPLPSPFHARPCSLSSFPPVSLSIAFDRAYISLMRLPLFFFPSLSLSLSLLLARSLALSHRVRLARTHGAAKFGRTHAATCLRHLVQCVGGEREEIPRRGSFLHRTVQRAPSLSRSLSFSSSHAGTTRSRSLSHRLTISVST